MDPNKWADYWRNTVGVNVIPTVGKLKIPKEKWLKDPRGNWQTDPIPISIHNEWKKTGAFDEGMAVICGKVLHRSDRKHLYLCAIDTDNKKAIDELTSDIEQMAKKTVVEQHANPNTAHFYFYTTKPMRKKSSDSTNAKLLKKMKANEIPSIEMKGEGTHGIMYCTPSPHKDGSNYNILGTKTPAILDDIGNVVEKICEKWGLGIGDDGKVPMKLLMETDTKIIAGHNRHEAIMRYAESILRRFPKMTEQEFKDMVMLKNKRMCDPPLTDEEMDKQIECAINFIDEQIAQENALKQHRKELFGTEEFWSEITIYKQAFNPQGKFLKCLECKEDIEANVFDQKHYGHKVDIK